MFNKTKLTLAVLFILLFSTSHLPLSAQAAEAEYTNPETSYEAILLDDAELLTQEEKRIVLEQMKKITMFGNAVYKSIEVNPRNTAASYAAKYYRECFSYSDGVLFLIDMDTREIYIHCEGSISYMITDSDCDIITDNVYRYASKEEYGECARLVFEQVDTLLNGNEIAKPMKYISNALLAIVFALLINYFITEWMSRPKKPSTKEAVNAVSIKCDIVNPNTKLIKETKQYAPRSSSSGVGGRGGGGSRGGGGRSSGGGHRF